MPRKSSKSKAGGLLDGDEPDGSEISLGFNTAYAKRFEHNNKRTELEQLSRKHPELAHRLSRGSAGDGDAEGETSSSSSDDDPELEGGKDVGSVLQLLDKLKKKDPSVYDADAKFFGGSDDSDAEPKLKKPAKAQYLKDVLAKQAIEGAEEGASSDDDDAGHAPRGNIQAYNEEQRQLRGAFLGAAGGGAGPTGRGQEEEEEEEDGGFGGMTVKKRAAGADAPTGPSNDQTQELLDTVFGAGPAASREDLFLKDYFAHSKWRQSDGEESVSGDEAGGGEDDTPAVEEAERFEASYNFRHEDPSAQGIHTYPRQIEASVRRKDSKRATARAERAARKAAEEAARQAEVKQLKNLKRQEVDAQMKRVAAVAGTGAKVGAKDMKQLIKGDFDAAAWDAHMAAMFDDEFYEDEAAAQEGLSDILAERIDDGGGGEVGAAGFAALHSRLHGETAPLPEGEEGDSGSEGAAASGEDASGDSEGGGSAETRSVEAAEEDAPLSPQREAERAAEAAKVQQLLEEYYQLDFEDEAGGLKTRFKYREVPKAHFGLGVGDILRLDEAALNSVVGMKKLAPYRDDAHRIRPNYKALKSLTGREDQRGARRLWGSEPVAGVRPARRAAAAADPALKRAAKQRRREEAAAALAAEIAPPGSTQPGGAVKKRKAMKKGVKSGAASGSKKRGREPAESEQPAAANPAADEAHRAEARRQSYGKPELKVPGASRKKQKRDAKTVAPPPPAVPGGPALTKAQKKNAQRARHRAAVKSGQ